MHASMAVAYESRRRKLGSRELGASAMMPPERELPSENSGPPPADLAREAETKRAVRELLDVLPKDVLEELNTGSIDLNDPAFLDGLTDHVSRLSLASPQTGQKILGKIIKLKKLIARSLRESDPEVAVSATITRQGERVGRNDTCPCGSGKKYKQCCLRGKIGD